MGTQEERGGGRGQAFTGLFGPATQDILPEGGVLHLHLLRHGEVARLTERVLWGQEDIGLSDEGERQGDALARWLARNAPPPERVISSDLARCRLLGHQVARAARLELELEPRLREQHLGEWQGRTWEAITAEDPEAVRAYWRDYVGARPPGGESLGDVAARVGSWWSELAPACEGRRLVVVTHVGVLRVLLASLLGSPLDQALRFAPATGSHTALAVSRSGCVLETLGERPWSFTSDSGAGGARP